MNKLEQHRREVTKFRIDEERFHPRRHKRYVSKHKSAVDEAYDMGSYSVYLGYRNPFPPGLRHDAYELGCRQADPMGDHHGSGI